MLRLLLLPLFLFTLSMVCMGQTFQYSRGWTNGKRAPAAPLLANNHNVGLLDNYDIQDMAGDRKLERCLAQLQHFVGNALLHHSIANSLAYSANRPETETDLRDLNLHNRPTATNNNNNNNDNNNLFGNSNHHQSNDIFEALNAARGDAVDPNYYVKH